MLEIKTPMTRKFVKIRLLKTLNRTVLMCGCESWRPSVSNSQEREALLESVERNILRRIFGAARENGM